jgi:hypothetical protein
MTASGTKRIYGLVIIDGRFWRKADVQLAFAVRPLLTEVVWKRDCVIAYDGRCFGRAAMARGGR